MENLERELIRLFKELHAHPELGYEEYETTALIRKTLERAGIEILDSGLKTGLVAQITGAKPGRIIGLRCDIDALPIQEDSGLPYASCIPGKMHACGHDAHAAIMLGAALMLNARRDALSGTVKIVFQPAEEVAGGALLVLGTGVLSDVELFLDGHTYPAFPPGKLGIKPGPVMAAVDRFSIRIQGRGAHAAQPHKGIDPIVVQAALVQNAQTIVSRNLDPFAAALISITHVESGNTWNVIPETAFLEGTVRTLDPQVRALTKTRLEAIARSTAEVYDAHAIVEWYPGPPAVVNDAALCEAARSVALDMGFSVGEQEDTMGGEDFSLYAEDRPGVFVRIGTGGDYPAHHPGFTVDPAAIYPAARYFAQLAESLLSKGNL